MDLLQLSAYRTSKISQLKTPCRARAALVLQYHSSLSQLTAIIPPSPLPHCPTPSVKEYGRKIITLLCQAGFCRVCELHGLVDGSSEQQDWGSVHLGVGEWQEDGGQVEPPFVDGSLSHLPLLGGRRPAPSSRANARWESSREVMLRQRTGGRAGGTARSGMVEAKAARHPW